MDVRRAFKSLMAFCNLHGSRCVILFSGEGCPICGEIVHAEEKMAAAEEKIERLRGTLHDVHMKLDRIKEGRPCE